MFPPNGFWILCIVLPILEICADGDFAGVGSKKTKWTANAMNRGLGKGIASDHLADEQDPNAIVVIVHEPPSKSSRTTSQQRAPLLPWPVEALSWISRDKNRSKPSANVGTSPRRNLGEPLWAVSTAIIDGPTIGPTVGISTVGPTIGPSTIGPSTIGHSTSTTQIPSTRSPIPVVPKLGTQSSAETPESLDSLNPSALIQILIPSFVNFTFRVTSDSKFGGVNPHDSSEAEETLNSTQAQAPLDSSGQIEVSLNSSTLIEVSLNISTEEALFSSTLQIQIPAEPITIQTHHDFDLDPTTIQNQTEIPSNLTWDIQTETQPSSNPSTIPTPTHIEMESSPVPRSSTNRVLQPSAITTEHSVNPSIIPSPRRSAICCPPARPCHNIYWPVEIERGFHAPLTDRFGRSTSSVFRSRFDHSIRRVASIDIGNGDRRSSTPIDRFAPDQSQPIDRSGTVTSRSAVDPMVDGSSTPSDRSVRRRSLEDAPQSPLGPLGPAMDPTPSPLYPSRSSLVSTKGSPDPPGALLDPPPPPLDPAHSPSPSPTPSPTKSNPTNPEDTIDHCHLHIDESSRGELRYRLPIIFSNFTSTTNRFIDERRISRRKRAATIRVHTFESSLDHYRFIVSKLIDRSAGLDFGLIDFYRDPIDLADLLSHVIEEERAWFRLEIEVELFRYSTTNLDGHDSSLLNDRLITFVQRRFEFRREIQNFDWFELFEEFGTHFLVDGRLGGKYSLYGKIDCDQNWAKPFETVRVLRRCLEFAILGDLVQDDDRFATDKESIDLDLCRNATHEWPVRGLVEIAGGSDRIKERLSIENSMQPSFDLLWRDWIQSLREFPALIGGGEMESICRLIERVPMDSSDRSADRSLENSTDDHRSIELSKSCDLALIAYESEARWITGLIDDDPDDASRRKSTTDHHHDESPKSSTTDNRCTQRQSRSNLTNPLHRQIDRAESQPSIVQISVRYAENENESVCVRLKDWSDDEKRRFALCPSLRAVEKSAVASSLSSSNIDAPRMSLLNIGVIILIVTGGTVLAIVGVLRTLPAF